MKKYKQIDILRAIAVITVAMYHFWVVSGYKTSGFHVVNTFLTYGGELGVTLFFLLSGFSIYCSLYHLDSNETKIAFVPFMKKRFKRIYPQYITCILILVLIGESAVYLSLENIRSIITHGFLVHNLFVSTHGSISGVLWTMGVIVQFYIIAIPLYKVVKKNGAIALIGGGIGCIAMKALMYPYFEDNALDSCYFVYGRQLFSSLDNFLIGMVIAKMILLKKYKIEKYKITKLLPLVSLVLIYVWIMHITPHGVVYSNSVFGYTWHSVTALLLGLFILSLVILEENAKQEKRGDNPFKKAMLFIGRYEYGIYLWHLLIANNLIARSTFFQELAQGGYWRFALTLLVISITFGWLSGKIIDRTRFNI